jgi:hypothetical protein
MRPIKFRAWDKLNENIFIPDLLEINNGALPNDPGSPLIYMQYTGLKDKNGKEIYEGDIINDMGNAVRYEVVWEGSCWRYLNQVVRDNQFSEIIGNIYENPELIN